jgi:hypothetical protein
MEFVISPFAGEIKGIYSRLVLIEIVTGKLWIEFQAGHDVRKLKLKEEAKKHFAWGCRKARFGTDTIASRAVRKSLYR